MPIPKPEKDEKKQDFIDRCMGDETMVKEYPDEKQRAAICHQQWDDKEEKAITYQCECIECGYKFESEQHCKDIKCPKCGGDCRRIGHPGSGKNALDSEIEVRTFDITELRVEQREDKKPVIKGYAIVFNKLSEDLGGFREQVDPGAFTNSIKVDDIRAAFNHDPNYILGRNKAGTLLLEEDAKGINFEIDPPGTQWCRDLQVSIDRGDINQCSFKFSTIKDAWENKKDGSVIRTLKEGKMYDISIVTYPAYPQTSVKVRDYLNALSENKVPGGQGAPEEGCAGSLEIPLRRQAFLDLTK